MNLLVDHCVPAKFVRLLRDWGHTASPSTDHIAPDASDTDVVALAQTLDAILITADLDFANIFDYPPGDYQGILVLRYDPAEESALELTLRQVLTDLDRDALRGVLVIVEAQRYRIRRP
jgi:predicted nuclease of predicted toxin-antitoxin system